ncbi:hypothetical protein [Endozoicomonas sp. Mp262]|uniref:hypothetical protein n=1 Tax=Endozoicomonas sp. Mp262 TaxID=2919499 RepID=UPI0021D8682A
MCGIFGIISDKAIKYKQLKFLANHSRQRGRDSSGLLYYQPEYGYKINKADFDINKLLSKVNPVKSSVVMGHSRLITNGLTDNQPVSRSGIIVIHNGIVVNDKEVWCKTGFNRHLKIDTEVIAAITENHVKENKSIEGVSKKIFSYCKGIISCAIAVPNIGKVILLSNNGSLYFGEVKSSIYFASEYYPLKKLNCDNIRQVKKKELIFDIPASRKIIVSQQSGRSRNLIPSFNDSISEKKMLQYPVHSLKRCSRCILPETMPFIKFDHDGICNYCHHYVPRNRPRPKEEMFSLLESYRKKDKTDCIVPFSGGRDSCYALHLITKELNLKPVTYTYDWGMVTDLGRRNISRMCSELGVENIIIAADIEKKRRNIKKNLKAWLKSPHLGMISVLTAGDKHFFKYVEKIKKQVGVNLNLWGINPLEITHFKAGFLGVPPDFGEEKVYMNGWKKQIDYQKLRFKAMLENPSYFNLSLWDTLSGEYYRSFTEKKDYYHVFDYWQWDERLIDETLIYQYGWETAVDTNTTWRIGDGTAAFYNYIYYLVAGFSEHDTFRSNQVREGNISRQEALRFVMDENKPRYENIRWYLDTLGMDFSEVIKVVNSVPRLYSEDSKKLINLKYQKENERFFKELV